MSLLDAVIQEADKVTMEDIKSSRGVLVAKITDYSEKLQVFSWGLKNYFLDTYLTFDPSRSLEQMNYQKRRHRANADFSDFQKEVRLFKKKFGDDVDVDNAFKSLESVFKSFADMCIIVDCIQTLGEANKEYNSCNYANTALALQTIQGNLGELELDENMTEALETLTNQVENQLSLSFAQMSLDWSAIFTWSYREGVDTLNYSISVQQNDPVLLQKLLKSLYITQRLNIELHGFNDFFIKKLLIKLVKHNCEIFTEDHVGALVFNVKIDLKDSNEPLLSTVFNNLTAVFDFLESTLGSKMTEEDKKFMEVFGDSNRTDFCNIIINNCIKQHLPDCNEASKAYEALALELDNFYKFLVELKYLDANDSPFHYYINYVGKTLFDRGYEIFLAESRVLIKQHLGNGMEQVGADLNGKVSETSNLNVADKGFQNDSINPMFFPKCKISKGIRKISKYITKIMERSTVYPQMYGDSLAVHIRDVAVMVSLIPELFKENMKQNPLDIALYFNNCHFLAHTLVGPPWKMIMSKEKADNFLSVLMDQIFDLRVNGMEQLSTYLEETRDGIVTKIDNIALPWTPETFDEFDQTINSVVAQLLKLSNIWVDVLPRTMYEHAMCALATTMCDMMMKKLLQDPSPILGDIAHLLALRFQDCVDVVQSLFKTEIALETKMKYWVKFKLISKLFRAHLLELKSLWTDAPEVKQNFTCEEIRQIIKMRFPDNKYRLNILVEIQ